MVSDAAVGEAFLGFLVKAYKPKTTNNVSNYERLMANRLLGFFDEVDSQFEKYSSWSELLDLQSGVVSPIVPENQSNNDYQPNPWSVDADTYGIARKAVFVARHDLGQLGKKVLTAKSEYDMYEAERIANHQPRNPKRLMVTLNNILDS